MMDEIDRQIREKQLRQYYKEKRKANRRKEPIVLYYAIFLLVNLFSILMVYAVQLDGTTHWRTIVLPILIDLIFIKVFADYFRRNFVKKYRGTVYYEENEDFYDN